MTELDFGGVKTNHLLHSRRNGRLCSNELLEEAEEAEILPLQLPYHINNKRRGRDAGARLAEQESEDRH